MNVKPYRCEYYTDIDIEYANIVRTLYRSLPRKIIMSFDNYTENLMDENAINRKELLKAIEDYELYNGDYFLYTLIDWINFTNKAYNEPMCILL